MGSPRAVFVRRFNPFAYTFVISFLIVFTVFGYIRLSLASRPDSLTPGSDRGPVTMSVWNTVSTFRQGPKSSALFSKHFSTLCSWPRCRLLPVWPWLSMSTANCRPIQFRVRCLLRPLSLPRRLSPSSETGCSRLGSGWSMQARQTWLQAWNQPASRLETRETG